MRWKVSDYMLVLCQKLHICTHNRQKFSADHAPFGDPWPFIAPSPSGGARTAPAWLLHTID